MTLPDPIPAATLIILRDSPSPGSPPELLMVKRAETMAFAGGAWVFPGGRVDPGDRALAVGLEAADVDGIAARIAAIRETLEEVGLAIGIDPPPGDATIAAMRTALHDGETIGAVLADHGLTIHPDLLVPYGRWRPSHQTTRVFDARFYVTSLPAEAPAATVDSTENVALAWRDAEAMLATADVIFPTRRTLERLAQFSSVASIVRDAAAYPVQTIVPWSEHRDGVEHICIPAGLGYPVTAEPLSSAMRG
ncbi:NUDIX hydrolase [Sphingomonas mollis]|uniref:NUDIX domain-containing protein n=1 Tax=Sphingomonas mollis TaxID=2795726 RepID=A0ABS0XP42_9SPHN|nr:NUDIX domain-containing protein [Sphingomonas sp. BT553]MBJ6121560.1 NUDIX domain-containing protein [Sphingomonas sp. BT553]